MTAIPAWKQSLLEKRRRADGDEKRRLQSLNELPAWKRDLILKKKNFDQSSEVIANGVTSYPLSNSTDNGVHINGDSLGKGYSSPRSTDDSVDGEIVTSRTSSRGSFSVEDMDPAKDGDQEITYQPGFVNKLLSRFSTISVNNDAVKLKKAPSLENFVIQDSSRPSGNDKAVFNSLSSNSKTKFHSMDNLLTAEEKRLEFKKSPRDLSDSFGKEDKIIIIENKPPPADPRRNSVASKKLDVKKHEDEKNVSNHSPNSESHQRSDFNSEMTETEISVSRMKSLFEKDNKPATNNIPKKRLAPKPPPDVSRDTSVSVSGKLASNSSVINSVSRSSAHTNKNTTGVESSTLSKSAYQLPRKTNNTRVSSLGSTSEPVPKPIAMSDSSQSELKSQTNHVKNLPSYLERKSVRPISVINKINQEECADILYGAGGSADDRRVTISEAGLASIRRAGKSWFFTTSANHAPSGSTLVKMKVKRLSRSLPKREKTAANYQRKENLHAQNLNKTTTTRNIADNEPKGLAHVASGVHPVAPSRKRHAPQPPKHISVVSQELSGGSASSSNDVLMSQPVKSSLSKRTGKKMRIQFNDDATSIHEYPSEKVMTQHLPKEPHCTYADDDHVITGNGDDDDDDDEVNGEPAKKANILTSTPSIGASGSLSSYQSKYQMDYQFGMKMQEEPPLIPSREDDEENMDTEETVEITYADDETFDWSSSANSDMLF